MSTRAALAGLVFCGLAPLASAQLVSPVPPPPAPLPEYQPPAPPPPPAATAPAAQAQAEPDLPPIDLVKRDEAGKITLLEVPASEAALEAMMPDLKTDEAREKIRKLVEDRRAAVENAIVKNAKTVLEAREKIGKLDSISGTDELLGINNSLQPTYVNPPLLDMATQLKLLTPKELARARKAEEAYRKAATRAGDTNVDGLFRLNVRYVSLEAMRSTSDLLERVAEGWSQLRSTVGITDEQKSAVAVAERQVQSAGTPQARADAMAALLKGLSAQQQEAALAAVAKPMPADLPVAPPTPAKVRPTRPAGAKPADAKPGEQPAKPEAGGK